MKNLFKGFIGALVATMALAAFGGVQAAPLPDNFVAGNGASVAGTRDAIRVTKVTGGVHVTTEDIVCNGSTCGLSPVVQVVTDFSGAFWNSFVAQAAGNGWYRNGSANDFYSAKNARLVSCAGGSLTQFLYASTVMNTSVDACATFNAVKAASNQ